MFLHITFDILVVVVLGILGFFCAESQMVIIRFLGALLNGLAIAWIIVSSKYYYKRFKIGKKPE